MTPLGNRLSVPALATTFANAFCLLTGWAHCEGNRDLLYTSIQTRARTPTAARTCEGEHRIAWQIWGPCIEDLLKPVWTFRRQVMQASTK